MTKLTEGKHLASKVPSTITLCDQTEGQTEKSQIKQEKEEMDRSYKELYLSDTTIKEEGRQEMLQIKQEKEEMDRSYKERLYSNDTTIKEKDSLIKQLESSVDENKSRLQCMEQELKLKDDVCISLKGNLASSESEKNSLELKGHILETEKLCQDKDLKELLSSFMVKLTELGEEHASVSSHVSRLISQFERFYEMAQEEKMLMAGSSKDKFEHLQSQYVDLMSESNTLKTEINELKSRLTELQRTHEIVMVQHVEECQVAEDKIRRLESEAEVSASNINQLEKLAAELQGRIQKLLEDSTLAQNHKIEASLTARECQLSEAKKQYDLMLKSEKLELSSHLKELSVKNDQAINEICKKYELEKIEITNAEKEKAEKLIREIENKGNENLSQNKQDSERYLVCLKEEHGTMVSRTQQDNEHKESTLWAYLKEEVQRIPQAENELRKVNTHGNQMNQLHSVLDEKEQLYRSSVEREKTLEDQKLQVEASLTARECQLSEAKKQYDLMLKSEKLELSSHLKELSVKNDQAINEICKKYELEKIEITNAEKEKAEKLIRKIENKGNENLSQNKQDSERYLVCLKEEHGTMVARTQQDNEHKESTLRTYLKEEMQRISQAENELREVNTHDNQMNQLHSVLDEKEQLYRSSVEREKTLEDQKLQVEASISEKLQKYLICLKEQCGFTEEKQSAFLQSPWKAMGENQQIDQMKFNKIILRPVHTSAYRNHIKRKDQIDQSYPGNTVTIVIDPNDMEKSRRSYKRAILEAREWCRFNGKRVDLSAYFGEGAEVFTTPGKGTLHITYKYGDRSLTFPISGHDLYIKGWISDQFGGFKLDDKYIQDPNYRSIDMAENYSVLCKDGKVSTVRIGIEPVIDYFEVLYKCNGVVTMSVLRAVSGFAVHGPEAIRMEDVFEAVLDSYEYKRTELGKELGLLVNNYAFCSYHLLHCLDRMMNGAEVPEIPNKKGLDIKSVKVLREKIRVPLWSAYSLGNFKPDTPKGKGDKDTCGWSPPYASHNWVPTYETNNEICTDQTNEISEEDGDMSLSEGNEEEEEEDEVEDSKLKKTTFSDIRSSIHRFGRTPDWEYTDQFRNTGIFASSQCCRWPVFGTANLDHVDSNGFISSSHYQTCPFFGRMTGWCPKRLFCSTTIIMGLRKLL